MTRSFLQTSLKAGTAASNYIEPDHSVGEDAWPGRQAATRQLSLLDMVPRPRQVIDLTPSPETSPLPKRRSPDSDEDFFSTLKKKTK
jgi:hypothetical protein